MTLIDGVGDEVVQFVGVILFALVARLAWLSTNARPDRYRTVLVMRSRTHHPVTVSIRPRANLMIAIGSSNSSMASSEPEEPIASTSETIEPSGGPTVIPLQEMDSIADAHMAMMDNNRLHFYRRMDGVPDEPSLAVPSVTGEDGEAPGAAQIREMDSIVHAMEADVGPACNCRRNTDSSSDPATENHSSSPNESTPLNPDQTGDRNDVDGAITTEPTTSNDKRKILIKLKYLNDTLKEVEGSLDELLKDFKWRHFSSELSASHRVRLIFNGRLLLDDAATLRACGLHHRAVVHCLVHPHRPQQAGPLPQASGAPAGAPPPGSAAGPERSWDLENILMTLVSLALTVVWFFRCEYSNMFTVSASVALFGLTVFYSVAIFGLYLSDTFHFDRRAPQQPAAPLPAIN